MLLIFNKITIKYCGILFRKEKGSNQAPRMERTVYPQCQHQLDHFQAPRMERTKTSTRLITIINFQAPRMEQTTSWGACGQV